MGINKVVVNKVTKLDLTKDTVSANTLLEGITAHDSKGNLIVGTMKAGASILYKQVTLGTSWSFAEGYYIQQVAVPGLSSTDHVLIDILLSDDADIAFDQLDNYDLIQKIKILDGKIKVYAVQKTTSNITFMMEVKKNG